MAGSRTSASGVRVLVMDDDALILRLLAEVLRDEGYLVRTAPDGAEGLRVAATWQPDVVLVDLVMPVLNGWGFVERFRKMEGARACIIGMTAAQPVAGRGLDDAGLDELLLKPFNLEDVLDLVARSARAAA